MIELITVNWLFLANTWIAGIIASIILTVLTAGIQHHDYKLSTFLGCLVWPFAIFYDIGAAIGNIITNQTRKKSNAKSEQP